MPKVVQNVWTWILVLLNLYPETTQPTPLEQRSNPTPEDIEPRPETEAEPELELQLREPAWSEEGAAVKPAMFRVDRESYGALYFREDLLEKLPEYCQHLNEMRKGDAEAWSLYRRIGGAIITRNEMLQAHVLEPAWIKFRPSFGLVYLSYTQAKKDEPEKDWIDGSMFYFRKIRYPRNVQVQLPKAGDEMYELTIAYLYDGKSVLGYAYLAIDKQGIITPLKVKGSGGGSWDYPPWVWDCVTTSMERLRKRDRRDWWDTPEKWLRSTFSLVANRAIGVMGGGIQVHAKKDKVSALFAIHTERTPYFFKDREKVKDGNGRTKPIFHVVRTHRRTLGGGRQAVVHMHYRGLRRFTWNGYSVLVTVTGWHHNPVEEFSAATLTIDSPVVPRGMVSAGVMGKIFQDHVEGKPSVLRDRRSMH